MKVPKSRVATRIDVELRDFSTSEVWHFGSSGFERSQFQVQELRSGESRELV
jgi:hypothetical protein